MSSQRTDTPQDLPGPPARAVARLTMRFSPSKCRATAILALALTLATALSAAAPAHQMTLFSCHTPNGQPVGYDGWTISRTGQSRMSATNTCAENNAGTMGLELAASPYGYPNGAVIEWVFSAPSWATIAKYTIQVPDSFTYFSNAGIVGQALIQASDESDPVYDYRNLGGGSSGPVRVERTPSDAVEWIEVNASCDGEGGPCPANTRISRMDVASSALVLNDSTIPVVTGLAGGLLSGSTLSGTAEVSFTASDKGPGIYSAWLVLDGKSEPRVLLDSNNGWCVDLGQTTDGTRAFAHPIPCAESVSASLTLDTDQLAAGQHTLQLIVDDATGNQTIAYDGTITTSGAIGANGGAINGGHPHIANGSSPCAGEALEVAVNGRRTPPVVLYGKRVTVKGVLHCGTVPIRGARIDVATLGGPASAAVATSVQTGLDGSFSYTVPTGPDRTLQFSYTAFSDDPGPSASATAQILIAPRIRLRIGPHHTSNGHAIRWSGTIAGRPYPPQGVTLDVEVREGRHWRIFDQVVANGKGRFHYSYRFHATTQPTTYTFRVALPHTGSGAYPYTLGASNAVKVRVSP